MPPPLGFLILSHAVPDQLERLVATLNRLYDHPAIAIHHDFSQSTADTTRFPDNVGFVQPSIKTKWSDVACIYAVLAALKLLYRRGSPEWFTLLSAADYPVMPSDDVISELRGSPFDLYLDYQLAELNPAPIENPPHSCMGTHPMAWRRMAYDRYISKEFRYPSLTKRLTYTHRQIIIRNRLLLSPFQPFSPTWQCYAGDFWFTGNGKVADILMTAAEKHQRTFDHFRGRLCPEEAVQHTILANQPGLRICKDNKRYTNWLGQISHPRTIAAEDLPRIVELRSHFARKFSPDGSAGVIAEIDGMLGLR